MTGDPAPTRLDCLGLHCPQPIVDLARLSAGLAPGDRVELLADDPAAGPDVAAWCRMRGHRLVEARDLPAGPPARAYLVELGP